MNFLKRQTVNVEVWPKFFSYRYFYLPVKSRSGSLRCTTFLLFRLLCTSSIQFLNRRNVCLSRRGTSVSLFRFDSNHICSKRKISRVVDTLLSFPVTDPTPGRDFFDSVLCQYLYGFFYNYYFKITLVVRQTNIPFVQVDNHSE